MASGPDLTEPSQKSMLLVLFVKFLLVFQWNTLWFSFSFVLWRGFVLFCLFVSCLQEVDLRNYFYTIYDLFS